MKNINCPEDGDIAQLLDGTVCNVKVTKDLPATYSTGSNWMVTLVLEDGQELYERVVAWQPDRWMEQDD